MRKYGFTLIELLAVIVILAVMALIATPIILGIIEDSKKEAFKDSAYGVSQSAQNAFVENMYAGKTPENIIYTYTDGNETSEPVGYNLHYEGGKPSNGEVSLTTTGKVALVLHDGKWCATKGYNDAEITITEQAWADCQLQISTIITMDYNENEGINSPKLTSGMTPIKWEGMTEVPTTFDDPQWYDYNNKKWANAKTADGSYWVWIPRYVYKVSSNWHKNTTGTIDIQFSKGTDDNWNSSAIGDIHIDMSANASNNKWNNHPAFSFGNTELTGIWVAKFEASVNDQNSLCYTTPNETNCDINSSVPKISPGASSWRYITIDNAFTVTRKMEIVADFGWGTSGVGIDTHIMKNVEWGTVAYLSKSRYGKEEEEIWINPANNYATGCAGDSATSALTTGCLNAYNTINGVQASTTGNIYGIYDMAGGSWERVSGYVDNGNNNFVPYASSLINAPSKYKDIYEKGTTDNNGNNYNLTVNKKGDAVYETSSYYVGNYAWRGNSSNMPNTNGPVFARGGGFNSASSGGPFFFTIASGIASSSFGFRPVLMISEGI